MADGEGGARLWRAVPPGERVFLHCGLCGAAGGVSMNEATHTTAGAVGQGHAPETVKETLISIVIAFALAFVFRGFVIEAFVIPTGSMGPTLLGAHTRYRGPETGYDWAVGPLPASDSSMYADPQRNITVRDPMSGEMRTHGSVRLNSGDRILVLKYLYALRDPTRFDVVVFKNPTDPAQNYIKRLIGLPGEQIALVDGDVFVRKADAGSAPTGDGSSWSLPGWRIARKPREQQGAVWQPVFDTTFAPIDQPVSGTPWTPGDLKGWTLEPREYRYDAAAGGQRAELVFDQTKFRSGSNPTVGRPLKWAIDDYYPYNEAIPSPGALGGRLEPPLFPVSDVRVRAGIEPRGEGLSVEMRLEARRQEFRVRIAGGKAEIQRRGLHGEAGVKGNDWTTMASGPVPMLAPRRVYNVEFEHVDQAIAVSVDGVIAARAEYDWSPAERLLNATGQTVEAVVAEQEKGGRQNVLSRPDLYQRPDVRLVMEGASFVLRRVGLDRDLFYAPATMGSDGRPARATSPAPSANLTLAPDQFFVCGDNSPASLDGRLWEGVDEWVEREFSPPEGGGYTSIGVVPRDLMLGKAFFVYWPSLLYEGRPVPVPDFGRMRFIW